MNSRRLCQLLFVLGISYSAYAQSASYRVRIKDSLSIAVVGEETLSREIMVTDDGQIAYPYVGSLKVEGLTVEEIRGKIESALSKYYVNPRVTVGVSKSRPITASGVGAFAKPGVVEIQPESRLLNLIAQCGGVAQEFRPEWIRGTLIRGGTTASIDIPALLLAGSSSANVALQDGDVLLFQAIEDDKRNVRIIGEVMKPGSVPVGKELSLSAAIAEAGGTTTHAALAQATIVRDGKTIPIDLRPLLADGTSPSGVNLLPGDTLVVPTNRKRFSVLGSVRLPGVFDFPESESVDVLSAISQAGGQSTDADLKSIYIIKRPPEGGKLDEKDAVKIDLTKFLSKNEGGIPQISAGDVIFVSSRKTPTRPSEFMSFVSPFIWFLRP